MTLNELILSLNRLADQDIEVFGEPGVSTDDLDQAEQLMRCPFHPQHRELLAQYGLLGLQVRSGLYRPAKLHSPARSDQLEPMLIVPGINSSLPARCHVQSYREDLAILEINELDPIRMPLLSSAPGWGWFYCSDREHRIVLFHYHDGEVEQCEQDLFELILKEAHSFKTLVDARRASS